MNKIKIIYVENKKNSTFAHQKTLKKKRVICQADFSLEDMRVHCLYLSNQPANKKCQLY
jgi:hypothetical protein